MLNFREKDIRVIYKRFLKIGAERIILTGVSELLFVISLLLGYVRESRYRSTHEVVKLGVMKHITHLKA